MLKRLTHLTHATRLHSIVCLLVIASLTYLFLWRLWAVAPEDRAYLPEKSDLAEVFLPPRHFFAKTLAQGEFPLWNPHVYSGYPQFADPQAATFYPIAILLAIVAGPYYSISTIALNIGLHFFLAGAFAFLFFQRVFQTPMPALLGALIFEFGGYLTFYPPLQLSELEAAPWLPATLLLLSLALQRRSSLLIAVAGVSLGQVFLAGRPQSYLTIGFITLLWFMYAASHAGLTKRQIAWRIVLLSGFTLGTAAAQWIPTLQLTRLSTRSKLVYDYVAEGGFPFEQLTGFLTPRLLGAQNLYSGVLTLLLASIAILRRKGLFWAGIILVCLLGSVGKHLILFDAIYLFERLGLPGYLRNVERLAFGINFGLAVLSGYGLQLLTQESKSLIRPALVAASAIFAGSLLMGWLWAISRRPTDVIDASLPIESLMFVGIMLFVGLVALWVLRSHKFGLQIAIASLAILDVMSLNQGRFTVHQPSFAPGNDIERVVAAPLGRSKFYRITFDQTSSQDFGSLVGTDAVRGMPPLILTDYQKLLSILDDYRRNLLLNVEMVVTTGLYTDKAFELASKQDNFSYYRFVVSKPRAYLAKNVITVADSQQAANRLAAPDFDYWNTALVIGDTTLSQGAEFATTDGAEIIDRSANNITIQVTSNTSRLLVLADAYYPGWQADIDGASTQIYQTNVALRGVIVPSGTHTVNMRFRPATFLIGMTLSLLTLTSLLVWVALSALVRKRKTNKHGISS